MGLNVDVDKIGAENSKKKGKRKMGILINEGDKLTKEDKARLQAENRLLYQLPQEYLDRLVIPKGDNIKVYSVYRILNSRRKLSTPDQVQHLVSIQKNLMRKLDILRKGGKCIGYTYQTPSEYFVEKEKELREVKRQKLEKEERPPTDQAIKKSDKLNPEDEQPFLEHRDGEEESENRGTSDLPENTEQEKDKLQNESDIMKAFGKVKEKLDTVPEAEDDVDEDKAKESKTKKVTLSSTFTKPSKRQVKAARKKVSARKAAAAFSGSDEPSLSDNDYAFESTTPESKSSALKMQVRTRG